MADVMVSIRCVDVVDGDTGGVNLCPEFLGIVTIIGMKRHDISFTLGDINLSFSIVGNTLRKCAVSFTENKFWICSPNCRPDSYCAWTSVDLRDPNCFNIAAEIVCNSLDEVDI